MECAVRLWLWLGSCACAQYRCTHTLTHACARVLVSGATCVLVLCVVCERRRCWGGVAWTATWMLTRRWVALGVAWHGVMWYDVSCDVMCVNLCTKFAVLAD